MKSEEELREAFESVDSDESGVIDGDEVAQMRLSQSLKPLCTSHVFKDFRRRQ